MHREEYLSKSVVVILKRNSQSDLHRPVKLRKIRQGTYRSQNMYIQHRSMEDSSLPMYLRFSSYKSVLKVCKQDTRPALELVFHGSLALSKIFLKIVGKKIRTRKCRKLCLV